MFRIIRRSFYWLFHNPRLLAITILDKSVSFLPDKLFIKLHFRLSQGYSLNLKNPKTFNEKLQWLKFYDLHEEYTKMVDKAEAKIYVASIIGDEYIIPTLAVWNNVDDINWDSLPESFVIKPTNDSGGLIICKNKSTFDIDEAKERIRHFGKRDYSKVSKEYPYKNVPHRFIAEEYKEDESGFELKDYKFYCFNGRAEFCQIIQGRSSRRTIDFYDRNWIHQPFQRKSVPFASKENPRPINYEKMIDIASTLSAGIPFVRVDLYNIRGKIYFGELTFFPTSGFGGFSPIEWDLKLGDMLTLPTN